MKTAIIIGASSGIGRALAVTLSVDGYRVGVVVRRTDLLARLRAEITGPCVIKTIDVSQPELAMPLVQELIDELPDVELFIIGSSLSCVGSVSGNHGVKVTPRRPIRSLGTVCMR
jgi:short-subunit dehydrogenase